MTGIYHVEKNGNIVITELPIGLSPEKYLKIVKKMLKDKQIREYYDKSNTHTICFELKGFKEQPTYQNLGIRRRYSLSNMVLLDKNSIPIRYDTAVDIMETFYNERFPYFQKRKDNKLDKLQAEMARLNENIKFANAIINKDLITINVSKQMIYEKMKQLGIPHTVYDHAKMSDMNKESIGIMISRIDILQKEHTKLNKTSVQDLWLNDLKNLENKLKEMYN